MIRIDTIWLATEPMDMRAGTETALPQVIAVFGAAKPHYAYLFANRRANRIKVLVHDDVGIWLDRHEPENTLCACGCQLRRIGEDVSENWITRRACLPSSNMCVVNGPAVSARH